MMLKIVAVEAGREVIWCEVGQAHERNCDHHASPRLQDSAQLSQGARFILWAADLSTDARSPAFLALNPMGEVPVLVDGDVTLSQSGAIQMHVARSTGRPLTRA